MVKIDMGAHIDGFIAVVAHTVVISDEKTKITGRKADTILAAHLASEAALRLVKPGNEVCSIVLTKVSFFWDQSQDMGSSSFLLKKQIYKFGLQIRGLFFGGRNHLLGSQKKLTLVLAG